MDNIFKISKIYNTPLYMSYEDKQELRDYVKFLSTHLQGSSKINKVKDFKELRALQSPSDYSL